VGHGVSGIVERRAARVLLVGPDDRLLLFLMHDPDRPHRGEWWITPGGGLDGHETYEDAARRELFEETGIVAGTIGPVIEESVATWMWGDRTVHQHHRFFVVATDELTVVSDGWEESEHRTTRAFRWWSLDEIAHSAERILPENMAALAATAIAVAEGLR
jgi:8-oxo-dGTP pyrophosphatase MutT (NUDIX family)